jgi:peptide/nickel transport system substrate-binding protein
MDYMLDRRELLKLGAAAGVGATLLGTGAAEAARRRAAATPKRGGTMQLGTAAGSEKDTLDPALAFTGFAIAVHNALFNTLVRDDLNFNLHPSLATDWSSTPDAGTWKFKLRNDVQFHDGRKMTSRDVVFSFQRLLDPKLSSVLLGSLQPYLDASGVSAPDPTTIQFKLKSANAFFPLFLVKPGTGIVPDGTTDFTKGIGTGPFKLKSFEALSNAQFTRNDNYWRSGQPYLDGMTIVRIAEDGTRVQDVISGASHLIDDVPLSSAKLLTGPAKQILLKNYAWVDLAAFRDVKPFSDPRVALAMKYAEDRQKMMNIIAPGGLGVVGADIPIPPDDTYYPKGLQPYPYDPERSKALLKKAGYRNGLRVDLYAYQGDKLDTALAYKSVAKKAGIDVHVIVWPHATYWDQVWLKKPFVGDSWGRLHVADMLSQGFTRIAPYNESHFRSHQFDHIVAAAARTTDLAKQKALYSQALRMVNKTGTVFSPGWYHYVLGAKQNLQVPALSWAFRYFVDEINFS